MKRLRTFCLVVVSALLSAACGDDPATTGLSSCTTLGPVVAILDNHLPSGGDHALDVPPQHVLDGIERTYDIRGDNVGHTHTVTITAADFRLLQIGDAISVGSSNNGPVGFGHEHMIELTCP